MAKQYVNAEPGTSSTATYCSGLADFHDWTEATILKPVPVSDPGPLGDGGPGVSPARALAGRDHPGAPGLQDLGPARVAPADRRTGPGPGLEESSRVVASIRSAIGGRGSVDRFARLERWARAAVVGRCPRESGDPGAGGLVAPGLRPDPAGPVAVTRRRLAAGPWWEPLPVSTVTSHRFGDMTWVEVRQGQAWRLLTATFVHFGLIHVALNALGLINLGRLVEPWYRTGPFLAICLAIGGLGNLVGGGLRSASPWPGPGSPRWRSASTGPGSSSISSEAAPGGRRAASPPAAGRRSCSACSRSRRWSAGGRGPGSARILQKQMLILLGPDRRAGPGPVQPGQQLRPPRRGDRRGGDRPVRPAARPALGVRGVPPGLLGRSRVVVGRPAWARRPGRPREAGPSAGRRDHRPEAAATRPSSAPWTALLPSTPARSSTRPLGRPDAEVDALAVGELLARGPGPADRPSRARPGGPRPRRDGRGPRPARPGPGRPLGRATRRRHRPAPRARPDGPRGPPASTRSTSSSSAGGTPRRPSSPTGADSRPGSIELEATRKRGR